MENLTTKERYEAGRYRAIIQIAPVVGLCAAIAFTLFKVFGFFTETSFGWLVVFDVIALGYVGVAYYFSKVPLILDGELNRKAVDYAKMALVALVLLQWNLISYIFPFRAFWGFFALFAILPAFFFDKKLVTRCNMGLEISIALSWIINGDLLLPVKDANFLDNFVLRIIAIALQAICIYALTVYGEHFAEKTDKSEEDLRRKNAYLKTQNDEIILFSANMVTLRDKESGDHLERVKLYSKIIAEYIMNNHVWYGLNESDCEVIAKASVMHDVGKIKVPDAILLKTGKLTDEERKVLQNHTIAGAEVVAMMPDVIGEKYRKCCHEICLFHHERSDGSGYPYGIRGDDIPISAQIVSLADVYDALRSERTYKPAFSPEESVRMIKNGEAGGGFTDMMLECLDNCVDKFEEVFPRD